MSIKAEKLSFGYSEEKQIFDNFSFCAEDGTCTAIVGRNGAGKSTLLKLLVGILKPSSGSISINGEALWTKKRFGIRKVREDHASVIGYVMQRPQRALFANTVAEDIAFGPKNIGLNDEQIEKKVNEWLEFFDIEDLSEKSPFKISGGQQRKVAIAGVLAMDTQYICFDEPTSSLDKQTKQKVQEMIISLKKKGKCVILVSHDAAEVELLADQVIELG